MRTQISGFRLGDTPASGSRFAILALATTIHGHILIQR